MDDQVWGILIGCGLVLAVFALVIWDVERRGLDLFKAGTYWRFLARFVGLSVLALALAVGMLESM